MDPQVNVNNGDDSEPEMMLTVVSSDSRAPSVAASSSSTSEDCRRSAGEVCICTNCEAARTRMLYQSKANPKKRSRNDDDDNDDDVVVEALTTTTTTTAKAVAKKPTTPAASVTAATTTALVSATKTTGLEEEEQARKVETMAAACKTILECIGEDPNREGLVKTPERWAKSLLYLCSGYCKNVDEVTNGAVFCENHDEMVVVRNIDIHSLCEHHMVPFTGQVHIGYIPNGKILGLSKLARIATMFAQRLQVQERLTRQIADAIVETVDPLGVAVVIECTHFFFFFRGVQKTGAVTTTSSVRGCFESNSKTRAEFFSIIHGNSNSSRMC